MPNEGDFGFCEAMIYDCIEHGYHRCNKPGVFIAEIYEMSQPGHMSIRIRCVCVNCGAESTYSCIKCRMTLHDWSSKHSDQECQSNIIKVVIDS